MEEVTGFYVVSKQLHNFLDKKNEWTWSGVGAGSDGDVYKWTGDGVEEFESSPSMTRI